MRSPRLIATSVAVVGMGVIMIARTAAQAPVPTSKADPANTTITAVEGIRVGQVTLTERPTGCTVIVVDADKAAAGVSQRGGAPGTRETNLLDPLNMMDRVDAIVLTGGSAYGLDVATGVMKYLEEKGRGYPIGGGVVPIVPAAVLFDLPFGNKPQVRPTAECGYKAAAAATDAPVEEGNVGAGAGATVGKMGGRGNGGGPMKGGLGSAAIKLPNGLVVAAIVAVNAAGDIIDPTTGQVVAGARGADGKLIDVRKMLRAGGPAPRPRSGENTTIGMVATNAKLTKADANRLALMADDGFARAINPSHTMGDGDTVFAVATGKWTGDVNVSVVGALAAEAVSEAIVRAVSQATASNGVPAARDLGTVPARFR